MEEPKKEDKKKADSKNKGLGNLQELIRPVRGYDNEKVSKWKIKNFFISYYLFMKNKIKEHKTWLSTFILLLLTAISGIYINLFTNQDSLNNFFGINLTIVSDLWFMLAFGLIASISLLKASVALIIIGIIAILVTFLLYLIYKLFNCIFNLLNLKILSLFILMFLEFLITIIILFYDRPDKLIIDYNYLIKYTSAFLLLFLGLLTASRIEKQIKILKTAKVYNPRKINKVMKEKTKFAIWIVFLALIGVGISWFLSNQFSALADPKYIEIIITTAVFLAGFALLAVSNGRDIKNSLFMVLLPNVRSILLWSMTSIIFAFCYLIYQSTNLGRMFFSLSVGFLFFTFTLIILLILYSDNKYLKELETKKVSSSTSHQ